MKLNQIKSVSELFLKFMPHVDIIHEILMYETNDGQSKIYF